MKFFKRKKVLSPEIIVHIYKSYHYDNKKSSVIANELGKQQAVIVRVLESLEKYWNPSPIAWGSENYYQAAMLLKEDHKRFPEPFHTYQLARRPHKKNELIVSPLPSIQEIESKPSFPLEAKGEEDKKNSAIDHFLQILITAAADLIVILTREKEIKLEEAEKIIQEQHIRIGLLQETIKELEEKSRDGKKQLQVLRDESLAETFKKHITRATNLFSLKEVRQ